MRLLQILILAGAISFGGNVFTQAQPINHLRINKIIGIVNVMRNGVVIMTLKPGSDLPEITTDMTFSVVKGGIELQADGKTITGVTGSKFTVSSANGEIRIAVAAGAPVLLNTESLSKVVITQRTEIKIVNTDNKTTIAVEKGRIVSSNSAGGEARTTKAGETVSMSGPAMPSPAVSAETITNKPENSAMTGDASVESPAVKPLPPSVMPVDVMPTNGIPTNVIPTNVIPTGTVKEGKDVSRSNP